MPEQWIIRVEGREYGPADLATLREWKTDGRVLPTNPARMVDVDPAAVAGAAEEALWKTAGDIPGLFQVEAPPVQREVGTQRSEIRSQQSASGLEEPTARKDVSDQRPKSKPPSRNILVETFRIYFRGFFQFFALTLLTLLPSLCGQFTSAMIETTPNMNIDLRTMVARAFTVCMFVLTLVLWPIYVAGIQILSAELATGHRIGFLSVLNGAVKYWPRVAGLCIFVYVVFFLLTVFGLLVLLMMLTAAAAASIFSIVLALGLATVQIWLFVWFFIIVLFWQQFAVLENAGPLESLRESRKLSRGGRDLPLYQRPLWRGALIVSIWYVFVIAIAVTAFWPRLVAEWPLLQEYFNQLMIAQDPQVVLQKMAASLPKSHGIDISELGLSVLERILQPLLGIAFVVLYLDSKSES